MPHPRSGTVSLLKSLPATQKQLLRNTSLQELLLYRLIGSLSSASVARVWRYKNLIITIITITIICTAANDKPRLYSCEAL